MIGQRQRPRDPELPALVGQEALCVVPTERVAEWVRTRMLRPGAPAVTGVECSYARWKPGVSTTTAYEVTFEDGACDVLVAKRYLDGKDRLLGQRALKSRRWDELSPRLIPRAIAREECCVLFTHVADREVLGSSWLLDPRNLAHLIRDVGLAGPGEVRRRRLETELLRYKPERRAVYRADVRLRDADRTRFSVGVRVLPRADAQAVAANRRRFEGLAVGALAPSLEGFDERRGILVEQWLDVEACGAGDFQHSRAAGSLAARLHRPAPKGPGTGNAIELSELSGLFEVLEGRDAAPVGVQLPGPRSSTWCHGDLHPDQLARTKGGAWRLLDLDCLAPADPASDLASWIADACAEDPDRACDVHATELLSGYTNEGGVPPDRRRLWAFVAAALVRRAAATIRRLEEGAPARAEALLAQAREVAPHGVLRTAQRASAESKR